MNKSFAIMALVLGISANAFAEPSRDLNFCTGSDGGFYSDLGTAIGDSFTKQTGIKTNIIHTGGSVDNASKMKSGKCDMAIIQADAVLTEPLPADLKVVDAHVETVYWLHGKGGVDDFGKMEDDSVAKKFAFATVSGSGAEVTVRNWIETDSDYKGAVVVEFDDWYAASEAVAQGFTKKANVTVQIAGMLYIGRKLPSDITEDFGSQIFVGEVNDKSFASAKDTNGNPLYTACEIGDKKTAGLKTSTIGSPDSYCLRAQVVYNNDFHKSYDAEEAKTIRKAVDKAINSTVKQVR